MSKLLSLMLLISLSTCMQATKNSAVTNDLSASYSQAIHDFIQAANKRNATLFDTLFIARPQAGQAGDLADVELPNTIQHTTIIPTSPEAAKKTQMEKPARTYINLLAWVDKDQAQFLFVVFSNGFEHRYDCRIDYTFNRKNKMYELGSLQFTDPPFNK